MSANFAGKRMPKQLWSGGASIELPESVKLLLRFSRFCELRSKCPNLHTNGGNTPSCRASGGDCRFESCPKMGDAK
jgi:hypothetical protein